MRPSGGTTIGNTASITDVDQADNVPGDNTASVNVTVQRVDLSVTKSVDVAAPNEGQAITYAVVVSNAGPDAATGVEITDALPVGVTYQSATTTQGMGATELGQIGDLIHRVLVGRDDEAVLAQVRAEVRELCSRFAPYPGMTA